MPTSPHRTGDDPVSVRAARATASVTTSGAMTDRVKTPPERALDRSARRSLAPVGTMKIGEVADRLGLSLRSIRYYEETGLVSPASRTSGGFRLYSELDVQRLLLVMQMKPLDFTLDEMRQVLLDLDAVDGSGGEGSGGEGSESADAARRRLEVVSREVEERYASLRQRLHIATMFREHLAGELDDGVPQG